MLRVLLSPRMVALHIVGAVATIVAVLLGLWQYDAFQATRTAQARDLADAAPVALSELLAPDQPFPGAVVGRPVEFSGEWVPESSFLVDGRRLNGQDGFWAVTPVAVCDTDCADAPAMLVVRGWTEDPENVPEPPRGEVDVVGWLHPPEGSGIPDQDLSDDVLPELRIATVIQRVDQDLYGAYVIADQLRTALPDAALRPVTPDALPEPETFTAWRNLLYAVEWWVFGAFALFIWWRWCTDELKRAREPGVPSAP